MATNENGKSHSSEPLDLDRLIGELETEAARRRAEPNYPHDADARLHFELARRAPHPPGGAPLEEVVARVQEVAATDLSAQLGAATGSRRHDRAAMDERLRQLDGRVTSLGLVAAAALHALTARLEQLEAHARLTETTPDEATVSVAGGDQFDALAPWRAGLADVLPRGERVLYAQHDADDVVAELRAAGVDAYGITTASPEHRPGPDVRSGDLLTHLDAVDEGALGAAVLVGGPEMPGPAVIGRLIAQLGRVTRRVVVISEAPWWWRMRVGAVNADLAPARPLGPDTWLHAFHGVAMTGTAHYDSTGQSYQLVVQAGP